MFIFNKKERLQNLFNKLLITKRFNLKKREGDDIRIFKKSYNIYINNNKLFFFIHVIKRKIFQTNNSIIYTIQLF